MTTADAPELQQLPAVVIDCDGVLADTEAAWRAATKAVFPSSASVVLGSSIEQVVEAEVDGSANRNALALRLKQALVASITESGRAMPGGAALLKQLEGRAYAIASNAPEEVVRAALAHVHHSNTHLEIVALAPPLRPKPAPDIHIEACRRLSVRPEDSLALEDSIIGAEAARAAGLRVIGVGATPGLASHVDDLVPSLTDSRLMDILEVPVGSGGSRASNRITTKRERRINNEQSGSE
jgi:HAD superfamily hydrolase (TIGR01509 family)